MSKYVCNVIQEYHYQVEVEADSINNAEKIAREKAFGMQPAYTRAEIHVSGKKEGVKFDSYPEGEER